MSPYIVFTVIAAYFGLLIFISHLTSRKADSAAFFTANKKSPWFLVAFGMIGASLSGVTFISVPDAVGKGNFFYFQMVLGYLVGYFIIANVLLPLYYKLNLITIYGYLKERFGFWAYKTGAGFFLLSRVIGASFRLFLVAGVLQMGFFDAFGISFAVTVAVTIALIWVYTYKAGIKTIVWTDTLQTFFMLVAVIVSIFIIADDLNMGFAEMVETVKNSKLSTIFDWDWNSKTNFFKQFFAGIFMAIVMTGLDQDMMQKNLTCRNLKDAKKNMFWFSITLVPVNLIFLSLGALLYIYVAQTGIVVPEGADKLYPYLALNKFSVFTGVVFLLGITAAAFSSADSALTSLTTSFSVDFLDSDVNDNSSKATRSRRFVHLGFSVLIFGVILLFKLLNDDNVINAVFKAATYTYGPILGLFAFGLLTKRKTVDKYIPFISVASPIISFLLNTFSKEIFFGYEFGFELLIVNGLLTFLGLLIFSEKGKGGK